MFDFLPWLPRIGGAVLLVFAAASISKWQDVDLEKDMLVALVRSFVQLIAIGFALDWIFNSDSILLIFLPVLVMIAIAGYTAAQRAKGVPHAKLVATTSILTGATLTIATLIAVRVFPLEARYIIPIAGMIVGNSMNVTALVMNRLRDDLEIQRLEVETALALGATAKQAMHKQLRRALRTGMTPMVMTTKTAGLISLPGAMTGMILAGASPLEAVQLQLVVMYMLIGAVAFSGLAATFLTYPRFFTAAHQLKIVPR